MNAFLIKIKKKIVINFIDIHKQNEDWILQFKKLDCFVASAPRNDDPPTPSLRAIVEGEAIQKHKFINDFSTFWGLEARKDGGGAFPRIVFASPQSGRGDPENPEFHP
jgi:hypothetical protein